MYISWGGSSWGPTRCGGVVVVFYNQAQLCFMYSYGVGRVIKMSAALFWVQRERRIQSRRVGDMSGPPPPFFLPTWDGFSENLKIKCLKVGRSQTEEYLVPAENYRLVLEATLTAARVNSSGLLRRWSSGWSSPCIWVVRVAPNPLLWKKYQCGTFNEWISLLSRVAGVIMGSQYRRTDLSHSKWL